MAKGHYTLSPFLRMKSSCCFGVQPANDDAKPLPKLHAGMDFKQQLRFITCSGKSLYREVHTERVFERWRRE
jgi:hypothetical protein